MAQAPAQMVPMKRVAVDWDGTCVDDGKWPAMGDWLPGAVEGLRRLSNVFDEVVIWTCRTAEFETDEETPRSNFDQIEAINKMLDEANLPLNIYVWAKPYKPMAEVYIDNKALKFAGDWNDAYYAALDASKIGTTEAFESVRGHAVYWGSEELGGQLRTFPTGATRDTDDGKYDYEGFLSPWALEAFAQYMHRHRIQSDGTLRDSDNWQKGIPFDAYMKSMWRHFMEVWQHHRAGRKNEMALEEALCAMIFNVQGYLHELVADNLRES